MNPEMRTHTMSVGCCLALSLMVGFASSSGLWGAPPRSGGPGSVSNGAVACSYAWELPSAFAESREPRAESRFTYTQYHMGVDARLVVYAPDRPTAEDACAAAFARIAALDAIMSDYRRDSELTRLSARAGGPPVRVSTDGRRTCPETPGAPSTSPRAP
jgi:hypothetical protein